MKTRFSVWLVAVCAIGAALAFPAATMAQIPEGKLRPELPYLQEGSGFMFYTLMVLFTALTLLIAFRMPKRNAIDTES